MGLLFIGLLAGILLGFGLVGSTQGHFLSCALPGCFDRGAIGQSIEPQPTALRPDTESVKAKPTAAAKSRKPSAAKPQRRVALAKKAITPAKPSAPAKVSSPAEVSTPASDHRPDDTALVLTMAKATIAAKLEVPASAEFGDMDRAIRLNTFGRPVDAICGHVKGKTASGGDTGGMPFLYLVKEDDGYVVDGKSEPAAAAYRSTCH